MGSYSTVFKVEGFRRAAATVSNADEEDVESTDDKVALVGDLAERPARILGAHSGHELWHEKIDLRFEYQA